MFTKKEDQELKMLWDNYRSGSTLKSISPSKMIWTLSAAIETGDDLETKKCELVQLSAYEQT